jgi:hypothetical protein
MIMFAAHGLGILPLHEPLGKIEVSGVKFSPRRRAMMVVIYLA